ncbi:MAG: carboxypeptidase regulatory-like domain-containing protein [Candidatus Heimdallarchaeota archaeon]|nr:carboxypeptidase regulatory-like domain-containing protein [Candidatus Heimdallarchaeota archaeon]
MKNLKNKMFFVVIMVVLTCTMTSTLNVRSEFATVFTGYVKDSSGNPISGATITLIDSRGSTLITKTTSSSGYYTFILVLSSYSPYYLSAAKSRYVTQTISVVGGGNYNFNLVFIPEKIGVFFWASDAGTQNVINNYVDILEGKGYTKFFVFKDSTNVATACQTIDNYETSLDTIFVYIIGHGYNQNAHSYTCFRPSGSIIGSNTFRGYMDAWEAARKGILVESCCSGDWVDDFKSAPYIAMSSANEYEPAFAMGPLPNEGVFSHYFFEHVNDGYTDTACFNYAYAFVNPYVSPFGNFYQFSKISDLSSYTFFN